MCKGTQTTLGCGHHLIHYTAKCLPKNEKSQCKDNMKKVYIDDTCADCHPQVQQQMLQAAYDYHRAQAGEQWREARNVGDEAAMRELEWEMMMNVNRKREQNFKAAYKKAKCDDVQWK